MTTEIRLSVDCASDCGDGPMPVSFGVPFAPGTCQTATTWALVSDGESLPCQTKPRAYWPDGSVKWLLVDGVIMRDDADDLSLRSVGRTRDSVEPMSQGARALAGELTFAASATPFASEFVWSREKTVTQVNTAWYLTNGAGVEVTAKPARSPAPVEGALCKTTVSNWTYPGERGLRARLETTFYPDFGWIRLLVTLHNPNAAEHPGGMWDLGDPGSVFFSSFGVKVGIEQGRDVRLMASFEAMEIACPGEFSLHQASSGGDAWNSAAHVNRDNRVALPFRGFRLEGEKIALTEGSRASPRVTLQGKSAGVAITVPHFWQSFPSAITRAGDRIDVGLFPGQHGELFELQGGERKTYEVWLCPTESTPLEPQEMMWTYQRPIVTVDAATYDGAGVSVVHVGGTSLPDVDDILAEGVFGPKGIFACREAVDEYGWRHFGEIYADHEEQYYEDSRPLVSHYNNQFDLVAGFLLNYLRTGRREFFELGDELARHVSDIDIYWTREDRAVYNGGLFWFTDHYLHAGTSTHRSYTKLNQPDGQDYGGGPGPEHNFTSGLLLHYWLTGYAGSKEAVLSLAEWVIGMDAMDKWWGPTGVASTTTDPNYHGPGRGPGNSLNALLDAYEVSGEARYMRLAERLLMRVAHPHDNIDALSLLNAEKRWSYTMFMMAILKFLAVRSRNQAIDDRAYAYAHATFVHYLRWMVENERPYFDAVEELEFPTEAWACQELRKANVLLLGASVVKDDERGAVLAKGQALVERAWADLSQFSTRAQARALAIVMVEGLTAGRPTAPSVDIATPTNTFNFGTPKAFRPWSAEAKKLAKKILRRG